MNQSISRHSSPHGFASQAAASGRRYPDFIIGGAPKCGTTSLHFILDQHEEIALPHDEVHFFDADDPIAHPDFLRVAQDRLVWYDPGSGAEDNLDWYAGRFADCSAARLIGEDSTTYLMSELAPARIRALLPDVQLIFMLRHPVDRAYSQYWHLVKTSRTSDTFERAIIRYPHILLGSSYAGGVRRFLDTFGSDQVKVCLFEDFRADMQAFLDEVTRFLGAKPMSIDPEKTWFNRTKYPANLRLHRMASQIGKQIVKRKYNNHIGGNDTRQRRIERKLNYWWFKHINRRFMTADRPPAMRPDTRSYLEQHLSVRNAGLSDLLNRDLSSLWAGIHC